MPIERRYFAAFLFLMAVAAPAHAVPELSSRVERQVSSPTPAAFRPSDADEAQALARLTAFAAALKQRDFGAAYAMFRLSMQADTPRLEWEMKLRQRTALWADVAIRILRLSWYPDPAGQPPGLYVALDFRGDRPDGTMDCGYLVLHRAEVDGGYTVVRTDTSEVPPNLIEEGVPKVDVLRQLPCYLGPGIATAF